MNSSLFPVRILLFALILFGDLRFVSAIPGKLRASDSNSQINIRQAPTVVSPSPHYGLPGDAVEVLRTAKDNDGYDWYFVRFKVSGAEGWVRQDFLDIQVSPNFRADSQSNPYAIDSPQGNTINAKGNLVQARLVYNKGKSAGNTFGEWSPIRLWITRAGITTETPSPENFKGDSEISSLEKPKLHVIDLEGDRDPEVIVTLFTGGAHCCTYSLIYRYDPASNQYGVLRKDWGNRGFSPEDVKDLDGDGHPEIVGADDRFSYRFASYASTFKPVMIERFQQGSFVNVTRNYPKLVRKSAAEAWSAYQQSKTFKDPYAPPGENTRPKLAAYLAMKVLLGEKENGWQRVKEAYNLPDRNQFFYTLDKFLEDNGFY